MRVALTILALLVLTGCGGGKSSSPSGAYETYRQSVQSKDPAKVRKCVPRAVWKELGDNETAKGKLELLAQLMPEKVDVKDEKITGKTATLKVSASKDGQTMEGNISLVMEDGTWKVSKEEWSATLELSGTGASPSVSGPFFTTHTDLPKPHVVLEGHQGTVSKLVFTPDGSQLISCSYGDYSLRLWDPGTGRQLTEKRTENRVRDMALSPDGKYVYTADAKKAVLRYPLSDSELGTPETVLTEAGDALAISPDGKLLAATFFKRPVRIWKTADGLPVKTIANSEFVRVLRFSPDGKHLVGGGDGTTVIAWDTSSWNEKRSAVNRVMKDSSISDLDISGNNDLVGTGHSDSSVAISELSSGKNRMSNFVRDAATQAVRFSPDGKVLASGNYNHRVYLWDAAKGTRLVPLIAHKGPVTALAFSPNGRSLASGGGDRKIVIWRRGKPSPSVKEALNPKKKPEPKTKGPVLTVAGARNLLSNASANDGRTSWKTQGEVAIEAADGNPYFAIRHSGMFSQDVKLPVGTTHIVAAARASSERIIPGGITGLPYLYGYYVNKANANRFNGYLNARGLRLEAREANAWGSVGAVMKIPPDTGAVRLMLQQASGREPQNGSVARLDDLVLCAFTDEDSAKAYLKGYRAAASEFNIQPPKAEKEDRGVQ